MPPLPDTTGVAGAFAGVSGNTLLVAGGANFPQSPPWEGGQKVWHQKVFALDDPKSSWREVGRLPRPLGYGVSATTPQGVICVGGSDATRHYADVFRLSLRGGTLHIEELPALPEPLANGAGVVLGETLYVACGSPEPGDLACHGRLFALELSPLGTRWRALEPLPGKGRFLPVAAAQADEVFLVGGARLAETTGQEGRREYLTDCWSYRKGRGWRRRADLPHAVAAAPSPAPALGQANFFVLGGDDGHAIDLPLPDRPGFRTDILSYHTITDTWTQLGEVAAPRVTAPVATWQGRFVVPSGELRPGVRSPQVWSMTVSPLERTFGWLNSLVLVVYLLANLLLGVSFVCKNKSTDDFFRGGQHIPWWAAGISIFATMLSSISFMSIPAQGYSVGWNLFLSNTYLLLTPLVVFVYLPFYRRLNVTSAYEYLQERFNGATRMVASTLFILFQAGRIAIVLYLPALALATVSNLDVSLCILAMGVLCIVYTMFGGIEGVIWTDVAQTFVLVGGALWALLTIVSQVEGGVSAIVAQASAGEKFFGSVNWSWDLALASGWIIMLGSVFTSMFSYTASQDIVQRYVTTPDERGAARAVWANGALSLVAQVLFFAIGTALFAFYRQHPERLDPSLENDRIFPFFIVAELPAGVAGLVVAAIFAAAQSTLSSSLNSVATCYITDFHRRFWPGTTDRQNLRLAQFLTGAVGMAGVGGALVLAQRDVRSLWEAYLGVVSLFGGTISGLFVLGIFSRRAHGAGALVGAAMSSVLVFWIYWTGAVAFWYFALVAVVSCVLCGWIASCLIPTSRPTPEHLTVYSLGGNR